MTSRIKYLRSVAQRSGGTLYDRLFTLRVSVYVTAALLPLRVSPNLVSIVNLLVGISGWVLIGFNWHALVGVLLIHVYAVLDSVDGELARVTGRTSLRGLFLEDYSAYVMINGYWIAMGGYLSRAVGHVWPLAACGFLVAFGRLSMPAARRALLHSLKSCGRASSPPARDETQLPYGSGISSVGQFLGQILHPSSVWAVSTSVLVIETAFSDRSTALLLVVAGYFTLSVAREVAAFLRLAFSDEMASLQLGLLRLIRRQAGNQGMGEDRGHQAEFGRDDLRDDG